MFDLTASMQRYIKVIYELSFEGEGARIWRILPLQK